MVLLIMTPISCAGGSQGGIYEGRKSLKTRSPPQKKISTNLGIPPHTPPFLPPSLRGLQGAAATSRSSSALKGGLSQRRVPGKGELRPWHPTWCTAPLPVPPTPLPVCVLPPHLLRIPGGGIDARG